VTGFVKEGGWIRKKETPDGPAGVEGTAKNMPKDQAPGA